MTSQPCAVETCLAETTIVRPVPLCLQHGIETSLAILPLALSDALADSRETSETGPTPEPVIPTELERAALAALRVTNTPIGRRSIERAIRAMGGRCSSERGMALARWARDGSDLALFSDPQADQLT